jgi:hypothetical protein
MELIFFRAGFGYYPCLSVVKSIFQIKTNALAKSCGFSFTHFVTASGANHPPVSISSGCKRERPFAFAAVNPAEFPARLLARINFEKPRRRLRQVQSDLLAHLAHRARVVSLAAVQMAGRRRIPHARMRCLFSSSASGETPRRAH